ncbi:sulfatase-like hydrolase/transferase [Rasiella rasia]|uniref:Sulfatase-like hydrolase/transferase n=1 Tax=Rasiella rasia TaxID=2744027 RepID=A0A6G6GKS6_9FLAO|nr:sulfatase-like hydrolase/transferase [Rasiella rasia]QIE59090.1 sulfatase-like hydrolase/transferase [Rasiella rasia]
MTTARKILRKNYVFPAMVGLAAGLYPIIFFYTNNFSLINSWKHFTFFLCLFLGLPIFTFVALRFLDFIPIVKKLNPIVFPFFNIAAFLGFIQICLYAQFHLWITLISIVVAALVAFFLRKSFKKILALQFLLAIIGLFWLFPTIKNQWTYSNEWTFQPDDIEEVVFKKRPNVYYIQPDGYVNVSQMGKGAYKIDNTVFWDFLRENNFKLYPDVFSNYSSTLVSNTATFTMKHHYYNNGFNFSEIANARKVIISDNPVLNIFKNNGYKTHFIAEASYLLTNFPEMGYDACNFDYNDLDFITDGFSMEEDITIPLEGFLKEDTDQSKFFFIEIFKPGHVSSSKTETLGVEGEFELYKENLRLSNERLVKAINLIQKHDPDGLILIMADHGGYVGYEHMLEIRDKTLDEDRIYSAFSTQLSIKWPNGEAPAIDTKFKSGINTFRILFSYLAEDPKYLDHLQEDASFTIIKNGAPQGIYKVIDGEGEVVFKKH